MGERILEALRLAVEALEVCGISYAVIGGIGATVRGRIRFTRDLDILVETADGLIAAMQDRGFAHHPLADRHHLEEVTLLRFWFTKDATYGSIGVDIQVAETTTLQEFASRSTREAYQGIELNVARTEDLILMKLASWRPIDRADASELLEVGHPDRTYLDQRAETLGLSERLKEL